MSKSRRPRRKHPPAQPVAATSDVVFTLPSADLDESAVIVGATPDGDCGREAVAQQFLTEADVVAMEPIAWGSNYSFAVLMQRGDEAQLAIYKPRRGETPLWDFPDGTLYRREYAAYVVSQALHWTFIPTTIVRDGPHGVGSVQTYVDHDPRTSYRSIGETHRTDLIRIALFDIFTNNADRKIAHVLVGKDNKLWGIDHGLTFNAAPKLRTVIWEFCGDPIPDEIVGEICSLLEDRERVGTLGDHLREQLDPQEVRVFMARLERVARLKTFPNLDPYRNVPRGWW